MGIDQPWYDDESRTTDHLIRLMARLEIVVSADLNNLPVALKYSAVGDNFALVVAKRPAHDILTTY